MTDLPYIIAMEGGDTFARFAYSHDAVKYVKARSRKAPEVAFTMTRDFGYGVMVSCTTRFQNGKQLVD